MKLIKLIYVGRHGERGPLLVPSSLAKDWATTGGLTSKGEETQYKRGQYFREKYKEFLSTAKIVCQSSYVDRTIDSGCCFLSGLFGLPFASPQKISKAEKVAFLTKHGAKLREWDVDVLYNGFSNNYNPGIAILRGELAKAAHDKKAHFEKLAPIVPIVMKVFDKEGIEPSNYYDAFELYDLLECYRANDKAYPEGLDGEKLHKELSFIHHFLVKDLILLSDITRRTTNHYIFKEFISIITEIPDPSFFYYSSHDISVFAIILGLGYDINEVPPHTTGLTIEIYQAPEGLFANLEYRGECLNRKVFPSLKGDYIPIEDLLGRLRAECFKDDEEFIKYSGKKNFDYMRDYVNAKPIVIEKA